MKKVLVTATVLFAVMIATGVPLLTGAGNEEKLLDMFKTTFKPAEPLLPPDVKVEDEYKPGAGAPIGTVEIVQGEAYIQHTGINVAYKAIKGLSLYMRDTLMTGDKSRIIARLNDKSAFTLADYSKMTLTRATYNEGQKSRDTELNLSFGKARFQATKLPTVSQNYTVKTPTSVAGVRGSDFGLAVFPKKSVEQASRARRLFAWLSPVQEAHAIVPAVLATAIVTGQATTVSFAGTVGAAQTVGAFSTSLAISGTAATSAAVVGAAAAGGALGAVGPGMAAMAMPDYMDKW